MRFFADSKNTTQNSSLIWERTWQILAIFALSISMIGCAKMRDGFVDIFRPERIVPVFDPDAIITPQTGTVIHRKNGIDAMAVPIHDVKNVVAFGILIYNRADHWITFVQEDCKLLDQSGNIIKQIDKSQKSFYLKKNYRPKLPPEFEADVFRYDKTIRVQGGHAALPTDDLMKTNIMPKNRSLFFIYFPKRSLKSKNLRIIIPGVTSEFNDQQTTFVFKFRVQRG
jgi:hypothetical protein